MTEPSIRAARPHRLPRAGSWFLIALFAASLPAVTPRLYASDEIQYFAYLRSLWFDRDLSFENEYRYFFDRGIARAHGFHETFLELTTATGRRINFGTIGSALLWAPFYAAGDLAARLLAGAGRPVAIDGFSRPYLAAVTYGSAVYGFLAVMLSIAVARRVIGHGWLAGLVVWLGTPLLFYMYVAPGMAHATSAFAVAAFVATWLVVRERWSSRGMVALGALAALMTMVREQDVLFVLGPAADFLVTLASRVRRPDETGPPAGRLILHAVAGAATAAVCYLPQAASYLVLNGRLGPSPVVTGKMRWTAPHAVDVLLSPEHGFFIWTPLAALGVAGLVWLAAKGAGPGPAPQAAAARRIGVCSLIMVAGQVYVSGSIESWTQAGAFGQRRFVALTVLLVLGLAVLIRAARRAPGGRRVPAWLGGGALALCVWWNLGLMAQFGSGAMDRQRLDPPRNAYYTFAILPRTLPVLAARYLFDRTSFYEAPQRYEDRRRVP
jgi:hypothetical protein